MKSQQIKTSFLYEKIFTCKINEFLSEFQLVKNKSRRDCLFQMILGLIKSRKVQLPSIAEAMKIEGSQSVKSIHHRLEDFFREVEIQEDALALLLILCLSGKEKIRLCMDRTEWDFGSCQVNILMLIACQGDKQVPLYFELLDNKSGNSHTKDRIKLMQKVISLIGTERIGILLADREFVGHKWFKYLKENKIHFCIRLPKNHLLERLDGRKQQAEELASSRALVLKDCLIDGVWLHVYLKKLSDGDLLFLAGTIKEPERLGKIYRKRWTIETVFQAFKGRGFELESTHLKDLKKLKTLIQVVSTAFAFCMNLGIYQHQKVQKIEVKKHGYKKHSYARVGIDLIKDWCKQTVAIFEHKIQKFIRFISIQRIRYFKSKLNTSLSDT